MGRTSILAIRTEIGPKARRLALALSFILPLALWSLVSYHPGVWHPQVLVTDPGEVAFLSVGQRVERSVWDAEIQRARAAGETLPQGLAANPVYLPAPHEVAIALVKAFTTPPRVPGEPWLHESLARSVGVVLYAFFLSSILAVPLGLLAGSWRVIAHVVEPFVEFFRYLPAPAFGALAVAILGINDGPKVAIIVIGTFFQQVLLIASSTRKLDKTLIEAGQTLGARGPGIFFHVVVPGVAASVYRDQRILLGWAWTYLIVAEVVGTSTGITWFINQQAKYRLYDNVYAAIIIIGLIGLVTDSLLAALGKKLFPWQAVQEGETT